MIIRNYEDMKAWQFARALERRVYAIVARQPAASDTEFCRQLRRSASSAPRNMVEGFGRFWPGEFAHKLRIAIGELRETQDHLDKALEERYITEATNVELKRLADRAIGAAVRFASYLDTHGEEWKKNYLSRKRDEGKKRSDEIRECRSRDVTRRDTEADSRENPTNPENPKP